MKSYYVIEFGGEAQAEPHSWTECQEKPLH